MAGCDRDHRNPCPVLQHQLWCPNRAPKYTFNFWESIPSTHRGLSRRSRDVSTGKRWRDPNQPPPGCQSSRKQSPGFRTDPFSSCPGRCFGSQQHPGHTCRQAGRICGSRNQTRISWWDEQPNSWGKEAGKEEGREWSHLCLPKVLSRPRTGRVRALGSHLCRGCE